MVDILADADFFSAAGPDDHGEHLSIPERVVVAPVNGVFAPVAGVAAPPPGRPVRRTPRSGANRIPTGSAVGAWPGGAWAVGAWGAYVVVGDLVGRVGGTDVRTPFSGRMVGYLARAGDRVVAGQPLAWLRVPIHDGAIG